MSSSPAQNKSGESSSASSDGGVKSDPASFGTLKLLWTVSAPRPRVMLNEGTVLTIIGDGAKAGPDIGEQMSSDTGTRGRVEKAEAWTVIGETWVPAH